MAGVIEEFVSGLVSSALREVLKKSGVRKTRTRRTRRRTGKETGGILGEIVEAALKPRPARKQVSRRRTAAARSKQRRRP